MTTHQSKRCTHCGSKYLFQGSGHGCFHSLNDPNYCKGCQETILRALATIPKRYTCQYQNISEIPKETVTLEQLLEAEKQNDAEYEKKYNENTDKFMLPGPVRRIFVGLIDVETGNSQNIREIKYQGKNYQVATWRQNPNSNFEINLPMEYDTVENKFTGAKW